MLLKRNYLKDLYNVDEAISILKGQKKELLNVIKQDNITQQGKYSYVDNNYTLRRVIVSKFKSLVTAEQFEQSIVVPLERAEKYLTSVQMKEVCREEFKSSYKIIRR